MQTTNASVAELLQMIDRQELQLLGHAEHRDWNTQRVRNLLDSVTHGYPTGHLVFWEKKGSKARLVLDGNRRLEALYFAVRRATLPETAFVSLHLHLRAARLPPTPGGIAEMKGLTDPGHLQLDAVAAIDGLNRQSGDLSRIQRHMFWIHILDGSISPNDAVRIVHRLN